MERVETKAEEEEDDESDPNESDTSQKTEEYTLTAYTSDTGEEVQVVVNKDGSSFVAEPAKSQSPTPTPSSPQSLQAGHMVPMYQPQRAFQLFKSFLAREELPK